MYESDDMKYEAMQCHGMSRRHRRRQDSTAELVVV